MLRSGWIRWCAMRPGMTVVVAWFLSTSGNGALVAFAAVLEGFLWAPLPAWQRLALLPGIVAVYWPSLAVEAGGFVLILVLLWMNRARR